MLQAKANAVKRAVFGVVTSRTKGRPGSQKKTMMKHLENDTTAEECMGVQPHCNFVLRTMKNFCRLQHNHIGF